MHKLHTESPSGDTNPIFPRMPKNQLKKSSHVWILPSYRVCQAMYNIWSQFWLKSLGRRVTAVLLQHGRARTYYTNIRISENKNRLCESPCARATCNTLSPFSKNIEKSMPEGLLKVCRFAPKADREGLKVD